MLKQLAAVAAILCAVPALSAASLLTSEVGYTGRGLDLSSKANGNYNFTFGPELIDGLIFTVVSDNTNTGQGGVLGQGEYGLGSNGEFGGDAVYAGLDAAVGYMQLLGTEGFSQFGLFVNYAPASGPAMNISSLDSAGNVIDTFDILTLAPVSTPDGFNAFRFRGIGYDDDTLIYGLRFEGSYILATGTANGIPPDPNGAIPEPATWAMLIVGFGMVGASMRHRRQVATA